MSKAELATIVMNRKPPRCGQKTNDEGVKPSSSVIDLRTRDEAADSSSLRFSIDSNVDYSFASSLKKSSSQAHLHKSSDRIITTQQNAVRQVAGNKVTKNIVCDEGETLQTEADDNRDFKYSDVQALK